MKCESCRHSYDGADQVLRCRVDFNGLQCTEYLALTCKKYEYEPGTDAEEFGCAWILGEQGRGD